MPIFGNSKPLQIQRTRLTKIDCIECDCEESLDLTSSLTFIYVLFVPFIPGSKHSSVICSKCDTEYSVDFIPDNLKELALNQRRKLRTPAWYFTGSVLLLCFIVFTLLFKYHKSESEAGYVKAPQQGDVCSYEAQPNRYSTFIIEKVTKDSVFVIYNTISVDKKEGIEKIEKSENYDFEQNALSRAELESLYDSGSLYHIER